MSKLNRIARTGLLLLGALGLLTLSTACGSYTAVQNGTCKEGRVWQPPSKGADGTWKAGSCKDAN